MAAVTAAMRRSGLSVADFWSRRSIFRSRKTCGNLPLIPPVYGRADSEPRSMTWSVHLLGPVELRLGGRRVPLGTTKQRVVLAMLALRPNRTVSLDRLAEGLWGDEPPGSAPKMLQHYVSQLRRVLAAGQGARICTHGRGYELRILPDAVDVEQFERLVAAAQRSGHAAARETLALWRSDVLADLADQPFAGAEIRRLDELWLSAKEVVV